MLELKVVEDDALLSTEMRALTPAGDSIAINLQNCFDVITTLPLGSRVAVPPEIYAALKKNGADIVH